MRQASGWQVKGIQLLSVVGLLIAFYLYLYHEGAILSACKPGGWSNCDAVSGPNAAFSSIGPIPVALIGLIGYAGFFAITWAQDFIPLLARFSRFLLLAMSTFALLFTGFLTALEAFVLHAWCQYCLMSAGVILLIFGLSVSYAWSGRRARKAANSLTATKPKPVKGSVAA